MYLILRRNWHLFLITIAVIVGLLMFFGDLRVIAYTVSSDWHEQDVLDSYATAYTYGLDNQPEIFDLETVHTIEIEINEEDFESMFLTYKETGEKEYFPVNVTIDGTTITEAGLRLKGNSSLASSLGLNMGGGGSVEMDELNVDPWTTKCPFMLKLDQYIDGQNYQGYTTIALRNGFKDEAYIDEVLSYLVLEQMGIAASEVSYSGVSINGNAEQLYILVEPVNEEMAYQAFGDDPIGDLIKAQVGAKIDYLGDDPTLYMDNFDLKTNENESDLAALIEFFQFFEESTDEEFEEELDEHMDVEALLEYMVFTNFFVDMDSFVGNGNNYYLYEDPEEENFIIIPWDLNQSLGGFWHAQTPAEALDIFFDTAGATSNGMPAMGGGQLPQGQFPMNGELPEDGMFPPKFPQNGQFPTNPPLQKLAPETFDNMSKEEIEIFKRLRGPIERPEESENNFVMRVINTNSFRELYIEIYLDMMEDIFTKTNLIEMTEHLSEIVLTANEERNFIDLPSYRQKLTADKEFLLQRIEFVQEALYTLKD